MSPAHNHRPWRPVCNERLLPDGSLRGACLADLNRRSREPETNDDDSTDQTQGDAA